MPNYEYDGLTGPIKMWTRGVPIELTAMELMILVG